MTVASEIFDRILTSLGVENGSQAAKKLGLAKQSVYEWRENIPSLDSLLKIAETGNTSLDFLVTGRESGVFEKVLENKIREIVREEFKTREMGNSVNIERKTADIIEVKDLGKVNQSEKQLKKAG